jgi:outer membrane receptor protein involved in Fe transport
VRREDYDIDAVTKPKASLRFEPTDWLTLRASYEEVFRQPLLPSVERRGVVFFAPVGETITLIQPVPNGLDPEESKNFGFGAIFKPTESLTVNVDYYSMAFTGPFAVENPNSASARKFLADGTVFDPAVHLARNVAAVEVEQLNGPDIDISGLDFEATYDLESSLGDWAFGLNGTYILEYLVEGAVGPLAGQSYDAAGKYNQFSQVLPIETVPLPKLKLNAFAGLDLGRQSARIYARYVDKYDIEYSSRQGLFPDITQVDSMLTFDAHYNVSLLNERVDLSLGVINIADENPPLTHDDWAYDSFTHNPLGRYFRIGLTYRH